MSFGCFIAEIVLGFIAWERKGMSVFKVEGRQLELGVSLPRAKSNNVFELFFGE